MKTVVASVNRATTVLPRAWFASMRSSSAIAAALIVVSASGCTGSEAEADGGLALPDRGTRLNARPLSVSEVPLPPLGIRGIVTSGVYLTVRGDGHPELRGVNRALRGLVLANQRTYRPYARSNRRALEGPSGPAVLTRGVYRTVVDRRFVSASTVVVSVMLPLTRETFRYQPAGEGWLSTTVLVPSGRRVALTDLFADPMRGLRAFGRAWRAAVRRTSTCADTYPEVYGTSASNYRQFTLTPGGLAVGVNEVGPCNRHAAIVPYRVVRPFLSPLGQRVIAGVRLPG